MNKQTKKWINTTLAVGLLSSGLLMGGGVTAEASSVTSPSYTSVYYTQEKQAVYSVEKAEQTKWLSHLSEAKRNVYLLKPSSLKSSLQNRLYTLESKINREISQAFSMIAKAEQTKAPQDIYTAKKYSSLIKDPGTLNKMQYRLDSLERVLTSQAISSVGKAEMTYQRTELLKAKEVVGYMNPSSTKTSLTNRLTVLERDIQDAERATYYVQRLESTHDKNLLEPAKRYTSYVDKASVRDSLMKRIAKAESQIKLEDYARTLVVRAEQTKSPADIERAFYYVNKLEPSKVKSELLYRLNNVKPIYVYPVPAPTPKEPIIVQPVEPTPTPIPYPIVKPVEPIVYQS